jgi:hypothetical protein
MAKKTNNITDQIIIKAPRRETSNVGDWRSNLKSADGSLDNESPAKLYDLFLDLLIDGVLADATDKRIAAITNSDVTFLNDQGNEVDVILDLIDTPAFEDLLTYAMKKKFFGRSGFELNFIDGFKIEEIDVRHINLKRKEILLKSSDLTGIPYENNPNIVVLGKPGDWGLFLKTAPYVIYKRGGFGDYAQWLEIFGMPQRVGKYNAHDTASKKILETAMENAGAAPWMVVPKETDIETVQNTGNGSSGTSYNDFRKACNEEILITIQGETLTTIAGDKGARSLGEVHQDISEAKHLSDLRYVQRFLNYTFLPILEARGYPVKGGKFVFPKAVEALKVAELVQLSSVLPIPQSHLYEKYGIPVPKENEAVVGKSTTEEIVPPEPGNPTTKSKAALETEKEAENKKEKEAKKKAKKIAAAAESKSFLKEVWDFFVKAPQVGANNTNFATKLINSITASNPYNVNVSKLLLEALQDIYGKQVAQLVHKKLFQIHNTALQQGINVAFDEAGADWGVENAGFIKQFSVNTAVFAAFKSHQETQEIVKLLVDETGNLRSFRNFKKLALKISKDYDENWLRTEYNTAVKKARAAVNYKRFLKTKHLYPNLEYLESGAANKRDTHFALVGTILPIEHPWWDTHLPPSDWNCDCSVKPTDKEPTEVPEDLKVNKLFANNPAKTAEFVTLSEVPYVKETDQKLHKQITDFATTEQERILKNKTLFLKLKEDTNYSDVKFNESTGGLMASHVGHNFHKKLGYQEKEVQKAGFKNGDAVIFENEPSNTFKVKHPDGTWNAAVLEIASTTTGTANNIRNGLKHCASKQITEVAVLYFPKGKFNVQNFESGLAKYNGLKNTRQYKSFKTIVCIESETIVYIKNKP